MEQITLERDDRGPLCFRGVLIAEETSERPLSDRWTELKIYRTSSESIPWVVQSIGVSKIQGERDFSTVKTCVTPKDVIDALRTKDGRLTGLGNDAAEQAAENDEDIDRYLDELFAEEVLR